MRHTSFIKVFIGLLIVLIDIRIGGFDLFNDVIGYFIVIFGVNELKDEDEWFEKAFIPLLFLFGFSVIALLLPFELALTGSVFPTLIFQVINLYFVFCMFQGIEAMGFDLDEDFADQTNKVWQWYLWINVIVITLLLFSFINMIAVILAVFSIVVLAVEIAFLYIVFVSSSRFSY